MVQIYEYSILVIVIWVNVIYWVLIDLDIYFRIGCIDLLDV